VIPSRIILDPCDADDSATGRREKSALAD